MLSCYCPRVEEEVEEDSVEGPDSGVRKGWMGRVVVSPTVARPNRQAASGARGVNLGLTVPRRGADSRGRESPRTDEAVLHQGLKWVAHPGR